MFKIILLALSIPLLISCTSLQKKEISSVGAPTKGFDASLSEFQYPFQVHLFDIHSQRQDLKMAYMDIHGGKNNDKVIVLFHGKNFNGAYFENLILGLNQLGFRVVVPDQIGFGKSSKPENYQYSFQQLAENTQNLLKHLEVNEFYLLGHSMGGMLATRYALMFPSQVKRLFLVNPIGLEDWKTMTSYRPIEQNFESELAANEESIKAYQLAHYYDNKWKPEYEPLITPLVGWTRGKDKELMAWTAALTSDMIFTQPVLYEFKNLKMPTVLIIGDRDTTAIGKAWAPPEMQRKMGNYPVISREASRLIPQSRLRTLKGLGHMPFIEDFEAFWRVFEREL